jgi:DNA-binding transcriptional ArsR family regulator
MRILMALAGRQATAGGLAEALPDVPQATLYRHIRALTEGGVICVVEENPVRGAVEKVYALDENGANLQPDELAALSKEDHMRLFVGFVAGLLDEYSRYLESSEEVDLIANGVGYRKVVLQLSDEELESMAADLNQALAPYLAHEPSPHRRPRTLSTTLMPDAPPKKMDT